MFLLVLFTICMCVMLNSLGEIPNLSMSKTKTGLLSLGAAEKSKETQNKKAVSAPKILQSKQKKSSSEKKSFLLDTDRKDRMRQKRSIQDNGQLSYKNSTKAITSACICLCYTNKFC